MYKMILGVGLGVFHALAAAEPQCSLRLFQDNVEVVSSIQESVPVYKLQPAPFRVEFTPAECRPGINLALKTEVAYLTKTAKVFSGAGYYMAGAPTSSLLDLGGSRNPRSDIEEEITMMTSATEWARAQYDKVCRELKACPTVAKAYQSTWPFVDPASGASRNHAEFSFAQGNRPLSTIAGRKLYLVAYTPWKTFKAGPEEYRSTGFYLFNVHPFALEFSR
jgi:hypothetical protein